MISPTERMIAEVEGAIGWMVFNNPARRNAMSLDMWQAVPAILDHFERDPAVRVIVLRGAGDKAFVSGADISEFEKNRSSPEAVARYDEIGNAAQTRIENASKPTIAMIRGFCMGGGVGVALQCDLRIASDNAQFGIPAARLGISYRLSGVKKLLDLVPPEKRRLTSLLVGLNPRLKNGFGADRFVAGNVTLGGFGFVGQVRNSTLRVSGSEVLAEGRLRA